MEYGDNQGAQLTTDLRPLPTANYQLTTMPINPVQFAHSVCDEFLRYIFSEFPLSDPQMESQSKELLERSSSLDIPLVKGPYVSLSEAFAKGDSIQHMAAGGKLHPVMPGLIGFPTMWSASERRPRWRTRRIPMATTKLLPSGSPRGSSASTSGG